MVDWFVVFFGHFYQPPRFNPWIELVDFDPTASPFHDWNERVAFECYSRLPRALVYGADGLVEDFVNLYSRMSFTFGPLLLEWLKARFPRVYNAIIEADKESISREGWGNAIAQPYSHIIMPLADRRYKELAINWGIRFFERTFERSPEGFWLPEAAVDYETLEILVDYGIKYVILAPHQIKAIRVGDRWIEVTKADPRVGYKIVLPSGRSIAAVVYDEALSRGVAFGDLLDNGEVLASRILESFNELLQEPQLVSIATDGETYGHHKRSGVEELLKTIRILESTGLARVSNYTSFLSRAPPRLKARIAERTSWSCPHGVERWRSNCGCGSEIRQGWTQEWRAPLRRAIDMLALETLRVYELEGVKLFKNPWETALDYIELLMDRDLRVKASFLEAHLLELGDPSLPTRALKILEALRHSLLAQSSDAWFFEDLYRPEPKQILRHAARVLELLEDLGFKDITFKFKELLREAVSNTGIRGDEILEEARGSRISMDKIVAIYAVKSIMGRVGDEGKVYTYRVSRSRRDNVGIGIANVETGVVNVISEVTMEQDTFYYVLLHLGGWDFYVGIKRLEKPEDYMEILKLLKAKVSLAPIMTLVDLINEIFRGNVYTLADMPVDDQMDVAQWVTIDSRSSLKELLEVEVSTLIPLISMFRSWGLRIPDYLIHAISTIMSIRFEESVENLNVGSLEDLVETYNALGLTLSPYLLDMVTFKLSRVLEGIYENPQDLNSLEVALGLAKLAVNLGVRDSQLEEPRFMVLEIRRRYYADMRRLADLGDEIAWRWVKLFKSLASTLKIRV